DPDLLAVWAHPLRSAQAEPANATAEHGVASDPRTNPGGIGARPDRPDPTHPFVAESQGKVRLPLGDVGHDPRVELDVGSADAGPLDVDQQLVRHRHQIVDLPDLSPTWRCDDEGAHQLSREK